MEDRLAVAANERDASWRDTKFVASGNGGFGEKFSQTKIQLAESARSDRVLFSDAKDFHAKRRRKFHGRVAKKHSVQIRRRAGDTSQRNVDSVRGCSGHHAEDKHGLGLHDVKSFNTENTENTEKRTSGLPEPKLEATLELLPPALCLP